MKSDSTIIILTYNSAEYIETCLEHCLNQTCPAEEIVLIDNASHDQTPDLIQTMIQNRPGINFYSLDHNCGFAAGMNYGISRSHSEYILCLNADLFLDDHYLETMIPLWHQYPGVGSIIGKIRRMDQPEMIDSVGNYLSWRLTLKNSTNTTQPELVFAANGCAPFYRRRMLESIRISNEYFDARYFAFMEDADLAWRAQLMGWQSLFWPLAGGSHKRSGTFQGQAAFLSKPLSVQSMVILNRYRTLRKNLTTFWVLLLIPIFLPLEIVVWFVLLVRSSLNLSSLVSIFKQLHADRDYLRVWRNEIRMRKIKSYGYFLRFIRFL